MTFKTTATLLLAFCAAFAAQAQQPMQPSGVAQAMMGHDMKDFFETAASANQLEIETGRLAKERATDPALKAYAQKMIDDHTKAHEELQALASRKGVTLPTAMLRRHQMMFDRLRDERGQNFDEQYQNVMVVSHKEAVSLFDETAREAKDPDVKAFAQKMLPKLQQHGGEAKALDHRAQNNRNERAAEPAEPAGPAGPAQSKPHAGCALNLCWTDPFSCVRPAAPSGAALASRPRATSSQTTRASRRADHGTLQSEGQ